MVHHYFDSAQAATFSEVSLKKDSTFEVTYHGFHGAGAVVRHILAASDVKFSNYVPEDWAKEKDESPFGVMPLLKETSSDGKVIHIAEADAIERYLCKKFDLYGSNDFEENLIHTFASNTQAAWMVYLHTYCVPKPPTVKPEIKAAIRETIVSTIFTPWVKNHEKHLADAGSNGHYVGNKATLADYRTHNLISLVQGFSGEDLISASKTPALWKVKTTIDEIPGVIAWKESEDFKAFAQSNFAILDY